MKDFVSKFSKRPTRPDFIIIGTMKGGTTRLYDFLTMHPDIERAKAKEIHYFSLNYNKGEDWYLDHFRTHPNKLTGEASPTYFHLAHTSTIPSMIKRINDKMKILLIVRDPVERAVSHYNHFCKINKLQDIMSLDVNEFFSTPYSDIITRSTTVGFYAEQAIAFSLYYRNYLSYESVFDKNDILVLSMQELRELPFDTMKEVYKFIGVPYVQNDEFKVVKYAHGTDMTRLDKQTFTRLAELFYPDYKKFCQRTGLKYSELDLSVASPRPDGFVKSIAAKDDTSAATQETTSETQPNAASSDIHIGKHGWLFLLKGSNNSIDYYRTPNLFNKNLINGWKMLLKKRIEYFSRKNIKYVHLFVPNKLTVYPEYFNGELPFYDHTPLLKFSGELSQQGETELFKQVIDPTNYFKELKKTHMLFWKTDTHWTFYGVFGAYQLICAILGITPNNELLHRPQTTGRLVMDEGGKLTPPIEEEVSFFNVLKNAKRTYANELIQYKENNSLEITRGDLHIGSNVVFQNEAASSSKTVVLFGDSFSEYRPNYLTGTVAETFREVHFVWSTSIDFQYVQRVKPDIVITEIVERFMPRVPDDGFNLEEYVRRKMREVGR